MRAVTILRSRPGRPRWQLTTRPSTAVLLGLASLAAAGVQVALFASPPPWYQLGVAGFWVLVGLAFLGSALGTRARARRSAAEAAARPPVDAVPFVPVPVRPARPRRRDDDESRTRHEAEPATSHARHLPAEVGEPTDPLATAEATTRLRRPSPTPRSAAAGGSRHSVRAVALAGSTSPSSAAPDEAAAADQPHSTAETVAIRDGRVVPRPRPRRAARPDDEPRPSAPAVPASSATAPSAPSSPAPAPDLPDGAVPRPRRAPDAPTPEPGRPRPAGSGRRRLEESSAGAPRALSGTSRHTAATARGRRADTDGSAPAASGPAVEARPTAAEPRPEARSAAPRAQDARPAPEPRPRPRVDDDATPPFGGGMTFGAHAKADRPSAPAPREPVSAPIPRRATPPGSPGRHAAGDSTAPARHAVRSQPAR